MSEQRYSLHDLAERFNEPNSTIRYYEEVGLLPDVIHKDNKHREYTEFHIIRMTAIECFKQTGLSIGDMKDFFECEKDLGANIDHVVEMMENHEKEIHAEIKKLQEGLKHINHKVRFYNGIRDAMQEGRELPRWEDYN